MNNGSSSDGSGSERSENGSEKCRKGCDSREAEVDQFGILGEDHSFLEPARMELFL